VTSLSDEVRRTVRTVVQCAVGLAAAMPWLVAVSGVSAAVPVVATALSVSAVVTRVMALPQVDALLPGWLRKGGAVNAPVAPAVPPPGPAAH
jgi:hypothetical protein